MSRFGGSAPPKPVPAEWLDGTAGQGASPFPASASIEHFRDISTPNRCTSAETRRDGSPRVRQRRAAAPRMPTSAASSPAGPVAPSVSPTSRPPSPPPSPTRRPPAPRHPPHLPLALLPPVCRAFVIAAFGAEKAVLRTLGIGDRVRGGRRWRCGRDRRRRCTARNRRCGRHMAVPTSRFRDPRLPPTLHKSIAYERLEKPAGYLPQLSQRISSWRRRANRWRYFMPRTARSHLRRPPGQPTMVFFRAMGARAKNRLPACPGWAIMG